MGSFLNNFPGLLFYKEEPMEDVGTQAKDLCFSKHSLKKKMALRYDSHTIKFMYYSVQLSGF